MDPYHRVFEYPGLTIADGSTVSADLGVDPSLTVTAQSERAFECRPHRGALRLPVPVPTSGRRRPG